MFGGMVRGEIDCSICCCGFSEYVNFYFAVVLIINRSRKVIVLLCSYVGVNFSLG